MNGLSLVARIARREVVLEACGRELMTVVPPFVLAAVVLAGLGFGPRPDVLRSVAPALSWLVVLFAAVPLARSVAAVERDEGCWNLLRALASPSALFGGKVVALALWLTVTWGGAAALIAVVLDAPLRIAAVAAGFLGAVGLAAMIVTFGVAVAGAERRSGLLTVLLCPTAVPVLLAAAQAATPGVDATPWLGLLAAYDVIGLAVAWAVFPVLLEE
jgi:heme exporter protein B